MQEQSIEIEDENESSSCTSPLLRMEPSMSKKMQCGGWMTEHYKKLQVKNILMQAQYTQLYKLLNETTKTGAQQYHATQEPQPELSVECQATDMDIDLTMENSLKNQVVSSFSYPTIDSYRHFIHFRYCFVNKKPIMSSQKYVSQIKPIESVSSIFAPPSNIELRLLLTQSSHKSRIKSISRNGKYTQLISKPQSKPFQRQIARSKPIPIDYSFVVSDKSLG